MLKFMCPSCHKDSYSSSATLFTACPFCSIIFSGEYGSERREDKRVKSEIPVVFSHRGQNIDALISNISKSGMGINIFGDSPLVKGDIIDLSIRGYQIRAQVMWVKSMSIESVAGLRRLN